MSCNLNRIPNVSLSNNFGGYIYSIDLQVGFNDSPSTCTVGIVNETGNYSTPRIFSPISINLGGSEKFDGFVYSYEITEETSNRVLSVTISDWSVDLDRTQVVLWNRGAFGGSSSVSGARGSNGNGPPKKVQVEKYVPKIIGNAPPFTIVIENVKKSVSIPTRRLRGGSGGGGVKRGGGMIVVGREEYVANDCDIPNVTYSFSELGVGGISSGSYKASYTGSLRSVLSSWCADLGYTFYWDWSTNRVKFIDLRSGVGIPSVSSSDKIVKISRGASADSTYGEAVIAYYYRPLKEEENSAEYVSYKTFRANPLSISMLTAGEGFFDNRSKSQFIYSGLCANLHDALRTYYNLHKIEKYGALGIEVLSEFEIDSEVGKSFMLIPAIRERLDGQIGGAGGKFIACYYDEGARTKMASLEAGVVSSFLGQYYHIANEDSSLQRCSANGIETTLEIDCYPDGERYDSNAGNPPPWADLFLTIDGDKKNMGIRHEKRYNVFNRSASLAVTGDLSSVIDKLESLASDMIIEIGGWQGSVNLLESLEKSGKKIKKDVVIFFIPAATSLNSKYSLAFQTGSSRNPMEQNNPPANRVNPCNFRRYCVSEDELVEKAFYDSLSDDYIKPNQEEIEEPKTGLINNSCPFVSFTCKGSDRISAYAPSESQYQGYLKFTQSTRKKFFEQDKCLSSKGGIGNLSGDIVKSQVSLVDVTSDEANVENISSYMSSIAAASSKDDRPRETLKVTATDFVLNASPQHGLDSMTVSLGEQGFFVDYSFTSKSRKSPSKEYYAQINRNSLSTKK